MSQPKINLKQDLKHNTAQYGFEGVMKYIIKVLHYSNVFLRFCDRNIRSKPKLSPAWQPNIQWI